MDQSINWNLKGMGLALLFVALLLSSMLFPPTRFLWDIIDQKLFLFLNSWIATNPISQKFWAIVNYKKFDWIHDLVFLCFFITYVKRAPKGEKTYRIAQILFAVLLAALVITYINKTLLANRWHIPRNSPTLYFPESTRLSEKITWFFVKDYSRCSFPADHGTTACLFVGVIHTLMGARAGLFATLYSLFFIAPRLIVGAHWLSDILVGSASIAILTLALGYCTPLSHTFAKHFSKIIRKDFLKLYRAG